MKIGILTFHNGLNHGAFLQVFATLNFLRKKYNDVSVINYKNKKHLFNEDIYQIFKYRNPFRIIDFFKKRKAFRIDQKELLLTKFTTNIKKTTITATGLPGRPNKGLFFIVAKENFRFVSVPVPHRPNPQKLSFELFIFSGPK